MPQVYVSILNYNGREDTIACLRSLEKVSKINLDLGIIIIDNASREQVNLPALPNLKIHFIKNKKNLGFSGGHNIGIKYALEHGGDFVVILNNDTIVDKNLIVELVKSASDGFGIVAPKIYFYKGFEFHKDRYSDEDRGKVFWYAGGIMDWNNVIGHHRGVDEVDHGQYDKIQETDFASGCCMLVKREVFEKIGSFDEKYFLYYEDNDYSQRAKKSGFSIGYNPRAFLWHKNAGSVGGSGSDIQDYFITRNRMLFGMKHASFHSKLSLIRESIALFFTGRRWQKRGIADFYMGRFGKGSFGL